MDNNGYICSFPTVQADSPWNNPTICFTVDTLVHG